MAVFLVVEGNQGQGKSIFTARQVRRLLKRNKKYYEKMMLRYEKRLAAWQYSKDSFWKTFVYATEEQCIQWDLDNPIPTLPIRRRIASNMKFSEAFELEHEGWFVYWTSLDQLIRFRHVDVIWDEIATHLDSRNWPNLSAEVKEFLSQIRKRGIEIYANTQDFSMVDARARIMITGVKTLNKLLGSPDPSVTKPEIERPWGLIFVRAVTNYKVTDPEKKKYSIFDWGFLIIERELTDMYDTTQGITMGDLPPLRHEDRYCEFYETPGHPCYHKVHVIKHV